MSIELHWADCFDVFPSIKDQSIDLILCDPPYGTTACKWDSLIDLNRMWVNLDRIVKIKSSCVLFAIQPFTAKLAYSKIELLKYQWYWKKSKGSNFPHAPNMPLKIIEDILVFSKGSIEHENFTGKRMAYYPQGTVEGRTKVKQNKNTSELKYHRESQTNHKEGYVCKKENYPNTLLEFPNDGKKYHPTQKPVALLEYLIKTYSLEGETVLDFTMGSGSTGVACKNTNRSFIGIEKEKEYFDIAKQRILTEGVQEPEIDICSMFN